MGLGGKSAVILSTATLLVMGSAGMGSDVQAAVKESWKLKSDVQVRGAKPSDGKQGSSSAKNVETSVPAMIQRVSPSVVGIIGRPVSQEDDMGTEGISHVASTYDSARDFAHGTGVILKKDGWIVTNAHVVDKITDALVVTSSGKQYSIEKSYTDEVSDLALIKINAKNLKPATLAATSKTTQIGEKVVALGTPVSFSLRGSATEGIVSGLNRAINASYRLIQTDAAINPGNSGGPLLNLKGEVIGINSMKYEAVGVENMGFSIPVDTVHYVINQLFRDGKVSRPSLGLTLKESTSAELGLPSADPLTVQEVTSTAAKSAGIQPGDLLYRLNNTQLSSLVDLNELLKRYKPGQTVTLWMQSGGDIVKRPLKLIEATQVAATNQVEEGADDGQNE